MPWIITAAPDLGVPTGDSVSAINQLRFSPTNLTMHPDSTVELTNVGTVADAVTFADFPGLSDPLLPPGVTWEIKFASRMHPYVCTIHPGMTGAIVVH